MATDVVAFSSLDGLQRGLETETITRVLHTLQVQLWFPSKYLAGDVQLISIKLLERSTPFSPVWGLCNDSRALCVCVCCVWVCSLGSLLKCFLHFLPCLKILFSNFSVIVTEEGEGELGTQVVLWYILLAATQQSAVCFFEMQALVINFTHHLFI